LKRIHQLKILFLRSLILITLFFLNTEAIAQDNIVLYYNLNWEITTQEKAFFYRECRYNLSNGLLTGSLIDYYINGAKQMTGRYVNGRKYGEFILYFPDGQVESRGTYNKNKRSGEWQYFYSNGQEKLNMIFNDISDFRDYSVISAFDSTGVQKVFEGNGSWVSEVIKIGFFKDETPKTLTGEFKNGRKHGKWKLIRNPDQKLLQVEYFRNGVFQSSRIYKGRGKGTTKSETLNKFPDTKKNKFNQTETFALDPDTYSKQLMNEPFEIMYTEVTGNEIKIKNRKASYPYGEANLNKFIRHNLRYPVAAAINKTQGTIEVRITIDETGKPIEVIALKGQNAELSKEAVRVMSEIEKWLPEIKDGKAVNSTIIFPFKFQIKY